MKLFRFKFENTWLKEPTFLKKVSEFWSGIPHIHLLPKLINVSSFMARWGRNFFHKFREKVKKQKDIIANLVDCTNDLIVKMYLA